MRELLPAPLPPDDLRQGVPGRLARDPALGLPGHHRLVVELLHLGPDDHVQAGLGLDAARGVLGDAGVLARVLALQAVRDQATAVLLQGPSGKGKKRFSKEPGTVERSLLPFLVQHVPAFPVHPGVDGVRRPGGVALKLDLLQFDSLCGLGALDPSGRDLNLRKKEMLKIFSLRKDTIWSARAFLSPFLHSSIVKSKEQKKKKNTFKTTKEIVSSPSLSLSFSIFLPSPPTCSMGR